jgi:hypothetical protein
MQTCVRLLCHGFVQPYLHPHAAGAGSVGRGLREPGHRPLHGLLQELLRGSVSLIAVRRGYAIAGHACTLLRCLFTIVPAADMTEVRMLACMVMSFPFLPQLLISVTHQWSCVYCHVYTMFYYYRTSSEWRPWPCVAMV